MGLNRPSPLSQRCLPFFSPLNNRLGQNPCQVARELIDQCDGQQQEYYDLAPLNLDGGETRMRPPNPGQVSLASLSQGWSSGRTTEEQGRVTRASTAPLRGGATLERPSLPFIGLEPVLPVLPHLSLKVTDDK
jgi:hypothetical protein